MVLAALLGLRAEAGEVSIVDPSSCLVAEDLREAFAQRPVLQRLDLTVDVPAAAPGSPEAPSIRYDVRCEPSWPACADRFDVGPGVPVLSLILELEGRQECPTAAEAIAQIVEEWARVNLPPVDDAADRPVGRPFEVALSVSAAPAATQAPRAEVAVSGWGHRALTLGWIGRAAFGLPVTMQQASFCIPVDRCDETPGAAYVAVQAGAGSRVYLGSDDRVALGGAVLAGALRAWGTGFQDGAGSFAPVVDLAADASVRVAGQARLALRLEVEPVTAELTAAATAPVALPIARVGLGFGAPLGR